MTASVPGGAPGGAPGRWGRWGRAEVLDAFEEAARWLVAVGGRIGADQWAAPGLGVWTVRELAGHAGRGLTTVEEYLADPGSSTPGDPVVGAATYFLVTRDNPRLHQDVAERGRQAGAALGERAGTTPAGELAVSADRVVAVARAASPAAGFATRFGPLDFATYLATRAVELVVHTLDLERACSFPFDMPARAGSLAVAVVGELALRRDSAGEVLLALGGRCPLPGGFGVFE